MARSTGLVLAAGGIALANDVVFAPGASFTNVNWRIIPATAILAATFAGLEKLTPGFEIGRAHV